MATLCSQLIHTSFKSKSTVKNNNNKKKNPLFCIFENRVSYSPGWPQIAM